MIGGQLNTFINLIYIGHLNVALHDLHDRVVLVMNSMRSGTKQFFFKSSAGVFLACKYTQ